MMNVLTDDMLYDSSSLMLSQNFKETLSQNKILASEEITFEQDQLHQINVSQINNIDQPLLSTNHSIDLYNSPNQIHLSSNTNVGFEDDVSVFSDSFPEIVPSWLTHDFMKASDTLPSPDILPSVSDMYPSAENEHLEMLDLGFSTNLTPQNVTSTRLDGQKLLVELPLQQFSNNKPLLMQSFNDVSDLNTMQYKQTTHSSLMSPLLSCENNLMHLPLHSSLTDQCLTSSPLMSNSQSQPVSVACDNLPQINLNHLDSFLGGKAALSNIQVMHHDFPRVSMSNELNCNQSSQARINDCHPTTTEVLNTSVSSLKHTQDISIQVSENAFNDISSESKRCYTCSKVSSEAAIEVIQCFRCKFCDYISIHKCLVESHIKSLHSNSPNVMTVVRNEMTDNRHISSSSSVDLNGVLNVTKSNTIIEMPTFNSIESNLTIPSDGSLLQNKSLFKCIICDTLFTDASNYKMHLLSVHNIHHDPEENNCPPDTNNFHCEICNKLFVNSMSYNSHMILNHYVNIGTEHVSALNGFVNSKTNPIQITHVNGGQHIPPKEIVQVSSNGFVNFETNSIDVTHVNVGQHIKPNDIVRVPSKGKRRLLPSTIPKDDINDPATKTTKQVSSRKKAWEKKLKRESGSYICEFKGCNVRFQALDNLEYHKRCHVSGGGSFACQECEATFEKWHLIAGHLWRVHKNDMELHACDQCQFRHYSLYHLESHHKKIHLDELSFLCEGCGKGYKNRKQMKNHRDRCNRNLKKQNSPNLKKKIQTPKKPSLEPHCKRCFAHFASRELLQKHMDTVHENKHKSHMCNYCEYTAKKKSTLLLHMRQHTGEKPFQCDQCDYRTSDHNSLRRHKMTHSGEKQYRCPFCPYSAIQASCYKDHMKKHPGHNGVMFSCEICSFKTVNRDTYILHVKDHQSINMQQNTNSMGDMNSSEEMYPEGMDISLSYGDNSLIPHLNKNMQSFFNCLGINMVSVGQESAT